MLKKYFYSFYVKTDSGGYCSNNFTKFRDIVIEQDVKDFEKHIQGEREGSPFKVLLSFQEIKK